MNINKARDIAFHCGIGNSWMFSEDQLRAAFHRLDRSQPEKGNRLIIQSDRKAAQVIWNMFDGGVA